MLGATFSWDGAASLLVRRPAFSTSPGRRYPGKWKESVIGSTEVLQTGQVQQSWLLGCATIWSWCIPPAMATGDCATAFQRVGLPFMALPDNGHSRSRQHFQQAWKWADCHLQYPLKHLEVHMLQCLLRTCFSFKCISETAIV